MLATLQRHEKQDFSCVCYKKSYYNEADLRRNLFDSLILSADRRMTILIIVVRRCVRTRDKRGRLRGVSISPSRLRARYLSAAMTGSKASQHSSLTIRNAPSCERRRVQPSHNSEELLL